MYKSRSTTCSIEIFYKYTLIHVFYLCTDNYIIQLSLEFVFANLVYSKFMFLVDCFRSFIKSAIKEGDPKQTIVF